MKFLTDKRTVARITQDNLKATRNVEVTVDTSEEKRVEYEKRIQLLENKVADLQTRVTALERILSP